LSIFSISRQIRSFLPWLSVASLESRQSTGFDNSSRVPPDQGIFYEPRHTQKYAQLRTMPRSPRIVTQEAIAAVMTAFLAGCEASDEAARVVNAAHEQGNSARRLSRMLSQAECEEEMADIATEPVGDVAEEIIRNLYSELLARSPVEQELKAWTGAARSMSVIDLVKVFVASDEFKRRLKDIPA
jgi:hypothetical protein